MVTPEIAHQFGMNGELAQMTPTHFRSLGGNAMAAATATGAMSHQGKNKLVIEFNLGFPIYPARRTESKIFFRFGDCLVLRNGISATGWPSVAPAKVHRIPPNSPLRRPHGRLAFAP